MAIEQSSPIESLIPLLQSGDDQAFAILYDSFAALLYGVIIRIVDDPDDAANLLQDSFVKVWQNVQTYDPEKGRLATWLINIARNTAIDFTRSKYFSQKRKNQSLENIVISETPTNSPHSQLESLGLRQLVEKLTPAYRQIIEWMYFEGYTQQEIADTFHLPLGTVKSRTRLALKELRNFFISIKELPNKL